MSGEESTRRAKEVEIVAKAIHAQAVKEARDLIAAQVLPVERITMVFEEADKSSDREAAIVIFCLVDDLATDFFRKKLIGKVSSGVDETFLSGNGMLASAYNKVALLAGLQWITEHTCNLSLMRKVRNEFAHHVDYKRFEDKPICNLVNTMPAHENGILPAITSPKPDKLSLRTKFLVRSGLVVQSMVLDFAFIQAAIANRVSPRSVSSDYDNMPENMRSFARTMATILISIIINQPAESK